MNFNAAVQEVVLTTKRPDKIGEIRREVNAAISFYCLDNEFGSDYQEQSITLDPAAYTQAFAKSLMTRFRKFKFLKRGGTSKFLTRISEAEMIKGCSISNDKYYEIGTNVNVALAALASTLDVGYWSYPPLLANEDTFWLLDVAPYMVIDRACAVIFRSIGETTAMQAHMVTAREAYLAARKDFGISTQ